MHSRFPRDPRQRLQPFLQSSVKLFRSCGVVPAEHRIELEADEVRPTGRTARNGPLPFIYENDWHHVYSEFITTSEFCAVCHNYVKS